jgi:hypothetical protein
MIVAEYRDPLPTVFTSTAATFTGMGGFSACFVRGLNITAETTPPTEAPRPLPLVSIVSFSFVRSDRFFVFSFGC